MIVDATLLYQAAAKLRRRKGLFRLTLCETVPVEIAEFRSEQARVVIEVRDANAPQGPVRRQYRLVDGHWYVNPYTLYDLGKSLDSLLTHGWKLGPQVPPPRALTELGALNLPDDPLPLDRSDPSIREICGDTRDVALGILMKRATLVCLVDGHPFIQTTEPVLAFRDRVVDLVPLHHSDSFESTFSLQEADQVQVSVESQGLRLPFALSVVDASALQLGRRDILARDVARFAIFARRHVPGLGQRAGVAFETLQRSLEARDTDAIMADGEAFVRAWLESAQGARSEPLDARADLLLGRIRDLAVAAEDEAALGLDPP